jgi:hypothetical protein
VLALPESPGFASEECIPGGWWFSGPVSCRERGMRALKHLKRFMQETGL